MHFRNLVSLLFVFAGFFQTDHVAAAGGDIDPNFNPNISDRIFALTVQSDEKIVIGGQFLNVNGAAQNRLARLNTNGSSDTTFNIGSGPDNNIFSIVQEANGQLLVAGGFTGFNGQSVRGPVRLNSDGTRDLNYPNTDPNGGIFSMALQSDGKLVIGGDFQRLFGQAVFTNRLTRLTSAGAWDNSLRPNVNGRVNAIALDSNENVIFGGNFTTVNGGTRRLARAFASGSLDTAFNPSPNNRVYSLLTQKNGKILIGGQFTEVSGVVRNGIARVNDDGSLDASFNPDVNGIVFGMAQQEDGDILIVGDFTQVGGVTRNRIARVKKNGSLDMSFNPDANNTIRTVAIENSGDIIVGGRFTMIGGVTRNRLARIKGPEEDGFCTPIPTFKGTIAVICL